MNTTTPASQDYDASAFPPVFVTADIALFTIRERTLQALLIKRGEWPDAGCWAVPGGFVRPTETLEDAARRELAEEAGVAGVHLEQLRVFSEPGRDPRARIITAAFTALAASDALTLKAGTDAADAQWFPVDSLPAPLAFDHAVILDHALRSLRERLAADIHITAGLLPRRFTLTRMQEVCETISGRTLDKRNFRKEVLSLGAVVPTEEEKRGAHRPALLYEFAPKKTLPG